MLSLMTLLLATSLSLSSATASELPNRLEVDCRVEGALERALARAKESGGAEIFLHGICEGGIVITTGGVTLRGATPGSGLAALEIGPSQILVDVVNAQVSLRSLMLRGGEVGVLAHGRDAQVVLFEVELSGQEVGVFARNGAVVRLVNSAVRDGGVGVLAQFNATATLQDVAITGQVIAVAIFNHSRGALIDSTLENNSSGGVLAEARSDVLVSGGAFRDNGQVHLFAGGRSDATLLSGVTIGSETDPTQIALSVNEHSSIASFNTPVIYGDVTALDRGSIRIGNTTVEGSVIVSLFSDAYVSNAEITDAVVCDSGSDAVCAGGASVLSVVGCPSTTCGESSRMTADIRSPTSLESLSRSLALTAERWK